MPFFFKLSSLLSSMNAPVVGQSMIKGLITEAGHSHGFQLKCVLFIPFNSLPPAICTDYLFIDVIKEGAHKKGYG